MFYAQGLYHLLTLCIQDLGSLRIRDQEISFTINGHPLEEHSPTG